MSAAARVPSAAFIGGGVMAEAMLQRTLADGILSADHAIVAEPITVRREHLHAAYGVAVTESNAEAANGARLVVLAVKPQSFDEVAADLAGSLTDGQIAVSIMAGVPLAALTEWLRHDLAVRVMPNTPARIGHGMSVWTATAPVDAGARAQVASVLDALGEQWYVDDEDFIDKATAISGSGPAYVFRFVEALLDAAVGMGIPGEPARLMVAQTVAGAARLAAESSESPARLREMVTSRGGTTERALETLEAQGFGPMMAMAAQAAYERAKELGGRS